MKERKKKGKINTRRLRKLHTYIHPSIFNTTLFLNSELWWSTGTSPAVIGQRYCDTLDTSLVSQYVFISTSNSRSKETEQFPGSKVNERREAGATLTCCTSCMFLKCLFLSQSFTETTVAHLNNMWKAILSLAATHIPRNQVCGMNPSH